MTKFFYLTFTCLVLLGAWQIIHLRSYFKKSASSSSSLEQRAWPRAFELVASSLHR